MILLRNRSKEKKNTGIKHFEWEHEVKEENQSFLEWKRKQTKKRHSRDSCFFDFCSDCSVGIQLLRKESGLLLVSFIDFSSKKWRGRNVRVSGTTYFSRFRAKIIEWLDLEIEMGEKMRSKSGRKGWEGRQDTQTQHGILWSNRSMHNIMRNKRETLEAQSQRKRVMVVRSQENENEWNRCQDSLLLMLTRGLVFFAFLPKTTHLIPFISHTKQGNQSNQHQLIRQFRERIKTDS